MTRQLILLFLLAATPWASAQTSFWVRNTDNEAVFEYWTIEGTAARPAAEVLPLLPLAPGGPHRAAPGERLRVTLPAGRVLVGVFVPWMEDLSFRSVVAGGFLLSAEVPSKGTLLIDRSSFASANRGRSLEGSLQQWNLSVPQFALGRLEDWAKVRAAVEWGPGFLPGNQPWSASRPRPHSLQIADREGALWLLLTSDLPWTSFPAGMGVSLVLRRPGAFLEWPLTGTDATVWSWVDGVPADSVGWRLIRGGTLEAWIPWDRLSVDEHRSWTSARATWSLVVTENDATKVLDLAPATLGEAP